MSEAKAKKLAEREEAQHMKVQQLMEQAVAKAAKATEKAMHAIEREENQCQRALRTMERAEGRQIVALGGEVRKEDAYDGHCKNPSIPLQEQPRMLPLNVPQVRHNTFPSVLIPIDMHGRFVFSVESHFLLIHLPHSQLDNPLLSTLHSTPSNDLPPSSGAFIFPYYVLLLSMQPNQPWPFHNQ